MTRRFFERAYRKFGAKYPAGAVVSNTFFSQIVVLGGVLILPIYIPMTTSELLVVVAFTQIVQLIENVWDSYRRVKLLAPAQSWLCGDKSEKTTAKAWHALNEIPLDDRRSGMPIPVLANVVLASLFITVYLGLAWYAVPVILVGAGIVLLYGATLRFFIDEAAIRPVLEDLSSTLPEDFELGSNGLSMKWKLLLALPAINVITGVLVASFSGGTDRGLSAFGIDVLVSMAVAFTLSLRLTMLLSRSILTPIEDLRHATEQIARGDLDVKVPVVSSDETGLLSQSFNRMAAGLRERERLQEAFGSYVDPEVAQRVLREGAQRNGEEVDVTVLFVDIRNFTAMAEQLSASDLVEMLNAFYDRVVPVLHRHGGHANKFLGDGLLGVFGAPEHQPDHADRAVEAAIEIAGLVRATYGESLRIGIGVNSGRVLAGTVGGGGRLEYTVIGDAVNTAMRVEELTRRTGDDILIAEATVELLRHAPPGLELRETTEVRGRSGLVKIYATAMRPIAIRRNPPRSVAESNELSQ